MADFLKDLEAFKKSKVPRRPCIISTVLQKMDKKEAAGLRTALSPDSGYTAPEIAAVLNKRPDTVSVSASLIAAHRAGRCNCV